MSGLSGLGRLVAAQTEALASLPGTLVALNRNLRGLVEVLAAAKASLDAVQRVAERADGLLDDLEPSLRALTPQLARAAALLERPEVADAVATLRETQAKITAIASSTERITSIVDDAGGRLAALPGAALFNRTLRGRDVPPL